MRELLTSVGSTYQSPASNFYRVNDDPKLAMETTTQLFLGVRMVCAQCHDHPFERWTQNQYFQLAAFFAAVGMKPGFDSDEQIVYLKRDNNEFLHPKTNKGRRARIPASFGRHARNRLLRRQPRGSGALADLGQEPVFRQGDRKPRVELFLRAGHHRAGR